jgi:hypothetical protein
VISLGAIGVAGVYLEEGFHMAASLGSDGDSCGQTPGALSYSLLWAKKAGTVRERVTVPAWRHLVAWIDAKHRGHATTQSIGAKYRRKVSAQERAADTQAASASATRGAAALLAQSKLPR